MNPKVHNQIVSLIWSIADDVLRDIFVRGKYRDIILPFTVLRRLDALLAPTKAEVLKQNQFLIEQNIDEKASLQECSKYKFWNISKFTFNTLLNSPDDIDANLEVYLDGFSQNIQEIVSKFKLRNQLETMKEAGITFLLIEKFCNKDINLSPNETHNSKGEVLPPLTNLGMGYVFEELIRKFNEENNEEAGEHFTPREIIKLMTHILFLPVKDKITKGTYLIYDPACGSGGMLTEAEQFALNITENKATFHLYGQEVNPETYAICTSDMLIKGGETDNIAYGSTLAKDGFSHLHFDFMLSNPPYGKTWKIDENAIVDERGKKGKEKIKDPRFQIGLPSIDDGQLLFLMAMVSKMKHNTELGSRIATVHNGSALFTGDAGGGASEIRRHIIENDWLECIIALPKNIFYNTGIPTYVWILSNKKPKHREGKVQLINAMELYRKLRKNLGQKNCEMTAEHINQITQLYLDFEETSISKIYNNEYFGYNKITVEQPLRLSAKFTPETIASLSDEERAKAQKLADKLGNQQFDNYNEFVPLVNKAIKELKLDIDSKALKNILAAVSFKNEDAARVMKKTEKNSTIIYESDSDLRDSENVPLDQDIHEYFKREVLAHIPDAWIDESKTIKGYEISFTRYFYNYVPPRSLEEITAEILALEKETDGILMDIVKN